MKTALVAVLRRLTGRSGPVPTAEFRTGPLWAWCPAERRETPHRVDLGGRRCLSCKTLTPITTETSHDD